MPAPQHCDSTCFHCAQTFFLWWKQREHNQRERAWPDGSGAFWAPNAATSVKPEPRGLGR